MKANPPQPPSKRGGSVFGISSGHVSSFTVKKSGAFFSPFLKGVGGDLLFTTTWATKKSTSAFTERDTLAAENEKLKALLASKQS
jgi:hypothetical protein